MRLSCNGCRVLRRGCDPDCPIRRCLINNNWIINSSSPDSQSNATLFLAKFYGRAGLLNLLTAAPPHLQPAVFKSLLYEACGRIVNPVFGSTGLLSTGSWHLCEAAVKAVLSGAPIQQALDGTVSLHLQSCDIRHVAKSGKSCGYGRTRRFKRRAGELMKPKVDDSVSHDSVSHDSVSHDSGFGVSDHGSSDVVEADSNSRFVDEELELELTLGWGPLKRSRYTYESRDQGIDH